MHSNILISSKVLNYDKPEYVYVPIIANAKVLARKNEIVSIGTPILELKDKVINSSVSGKINDIKNIETINGTTNGIEIINNYQEKTINSSVKRNLNKIKKEEYDYILKNIYKIDLDNKKTLILNCIDDEPYVLTENFNLFLYYDEFLELLDKISKIYKLEKIIITIKSNSSENISKLMNNLGMYPNISIEIVPDLYLIGYDLFLIEHLNLEKENVLIIKSSIFYNIYNLIKRNRIATNKLITITGDGLKNPSIINVKIGCLAKEVITNLINTLEDVEYIANGLMSGKKINIENFIITEEVNSIIIIKKRPNVKEEKCINCGACIEICPRKLNPLLFNRRKYKEQVRNKCIKCGLCSYICPVNINFNEEIKGEKNE